MVAVRRQLPYNVVEAARKRIRAVFANGVRVYLSISGGKDSLGLQVVMERAGVTDCVLAISALEYPAFLSWATDHMPWGLTVELREQLNLRWLLEHPAMLFPADADTAAGWFSRLQHAGQRAYCKRESIQLLALGRRRADGNHVGTRTLLGPEYRDRTGFIRYSPIADWTHEDLLHVIAAHSLELPPCYSWPRGFRVGTGPWAARQWTASREHGWTEVLSIDPTVVETAARHGLPGAREALACAG